VPRRNKKKENTDGRTDEGYTLLVSESEEHIFLTEFCGIALSNRQSPPALLTACMAINICCDRFTDVKGQQALMEIVVTTTQNTNHSPISAYRASLKESWGLDVENVNFGN
jgi:hypothetical protein